MENRKPLGKLYGRRVAVLATDGFEESELTSPIEALRDAGAQVDVISDHAGEIQGFKHHDKTITVAVDKTLDEVAADDYDAIQLPGGALNADALRVNKKAQAFVHKFLDQHKPIAAICHAPWLLVSSGLVRYRTLTSYHTIADDIRNAGGSWVDEAVVEDGPFVTSRQPDDLPAFNEAMIRRFEKSVIERAA